MQIILKTVFWASAFVVFFNYIGYPLLLFMVSRFYSRPARTGTAEPAVSFIIAAYNEEKVIEAKIKNTLEIDYPREKLRIIVVSDGSNDGTHGIASAFVGRGVVAIHQPERRGKTAALNRAVSVSDGEILVFSDANTDFNRNAVRELVKYFADETVGGVTGLKHIRLQRGRASSVGDSMYWKYESAIKKMESGMGSITAADGEIVAVRRSLFEPIDESIINDDAAMTFSVIKKGRRFLYETAAVSTEYASITLKDDFFVKVRMVAGGFQTLSHYKSFLWPPDTVFKLQFMAHKVLRWIVPECLVLIALSNVFLVSSPFYLAAAASQAAFYGLAAAGYLFFRGAQMPRLLYIPLYFTVMNAAAFMGLVRFMRGSYKNIWRKAQR